MGKVLIIGAGGVGTVVAHKCAQNPEVFSEIVIASRTKEKCDRLAEKIGAKNIVTDQVDADSVEQLVELMNRHKPELVINVALPYQDLTIMEACLQCGVNYLDTANYEPKDEAKFEYIMLGLRTKYGISLKDYKKQFGTNVGDDFPTAFQKSLQYLELDGDNLRIKDEYLYVQNSILMPFLEERDV